MSDLWNRLSNAVAVGLLGVAIVVACWNVIQRKAEQLDPDTTIITMSHTLLDAGVREALEEVAQDYEQKMAEAGKQVDIRLIDVPDRAYRQWARTQLIGGTAPHIIYTSHSNGNTVDTVLTSRYLMQISDLVQKPNPYNEGTELEGVPWRYTFHDGMHVAGYNFRLTEHYGIPLSATTSRLFVNRDMLEKVLAHPVNSGLREQIHPQLEDMTAREFFALCEGMQAYAEAEGVRAVPIAGSRSNARRLMESLFSAVTQLRHMELDLFKTGFVYSSDVIRRVVEGDILYEHPSFRAGFALMRKVALFMQPGFYEMQRDDATFYFVQEKAMMIVASSWDAASYRALIEDRFDMLIVPMPTPGRNDPEFGEYVLGPISEGDVQPAGTFSFVNYHDPDELEQAIDFMQYLTSVEGNGTFSRLSGWLPSIVGVEPTEATRRFMPVIEGYPGGFHLTLHKPDLERALETRFHLLFDRDGGVEKFYSELEPLLRPMYRELLEEQVKEERQNTARQDTSIGAHMWLSAHGGDEEQQVKLGGLIDHMDEVECRAMRSAWAMEGSRP